MEHVTSNYEQSQQQSGGTALTFIFMIVHLVLDSSLLLVGPMLWNWRALLLEKVVCPSPMDYSSIDRSSSLVPSQNHPSRGHACLKLVSTGDKWLLRSLDHAIYLLCIIPTREPSSSIHRRQFPRSSDKSWERFTWMAWMQVGLHGFWKCFALRECTSTCTSVLIKAVSVLVVSGGLAVAWIYVWMYVGGVK